MDKSAKEYFAQWQNSAWQWRSVSKSTPAVECLTPEEWVKDLSTEAQPEHLGHINTSEWKREGVRMKPDLAKALWHRPFSAFLLSFTEADNQ